MLLNSIRKQTKERILEILLSYFLFLDDPLDFVKKNRNIPLKSDFSKTKRMLFPPTTFTYSVAGNEQSPLCRDGNDRMEEGAWCVSECERERERGNLRSRAPPPSSLYFL